MKKISKSSVYKLRLLGVTIAVIVVGFLLGELLADLNSSHPSSTKKVAAQTSAQTEADKIAAEAKATQEQPSEQAKADADKAAAKAAADKAAADKAATDAKLKADEKAKTDAYNKSVADAKAKADANVKAVADAKAKQEAVKAPVNPTVTTGQNTMTINDNGVKYTFQFTENYNSGNSLHYSLTCNSSQQVNLDYTAVFHVNSLDTSIRSKTTVKPEEKIAVVNLGGTLAQTVYGNVRISVTYLGKVYSFTGEVHFDK